MNKRGEPTTVYYIITTILIVVGLAIVLMFLLGLGFGGEGDRELCALSVASRATAPDTVSSFIPLQCTPKKICITTGGDCKDFLGEKDVTSVKLPTDNAQAAKKIDETLAKEMYDCWSMMGEGKLSLFSKGFMSQMGWGDNYHPTCVICSRISFNIPENRAIIYNLTNLNSYLREETVPNKGETYLNAFTDRSVSNFPAVSDPTKLYDAAIKATGNPETNLLSSPTEISVVFSQMAAPKYGDILKNLATAGVAVAGGTAFASPGIAKIVAKGALTLPGIVIVGVGVAGITAYSMSNVYAGRTAAAGYCGKLNGESGSLAEGCSGVQVIPYEINSIKNTCTYIEGNI